MSQTDELTKTFHGYYVYSGGDRIVPLGWVDDSTIDRIPKLKPGDEIVDHRETYCDNHIAIKSGMKTKMIYYDNSKGDIDNAMSLKSCGDLLPSESTSVSGKGDSDPANPGRPDSKTEDPGDHSEISMRVKHARRRST